MRPLEWHDGRTRANARRAFWSSRKRRQRESRGGKRRRSPRRRIARRIRNRPGAAVGCGNEAANASHSFASAELARRRLPCRRPFGDLGSRDEGCSLVGARRADVKQASELVIGFRRRQQVQGTRKSDLCIAAARLDGCEEQTARARCANATAPRSPGIRAPGREESPYRIRGPWPCAAS